MVFKLFCYKSTIEIFEGYCKSCECVFPTKGSNCHFQVKTSNPGKEFELNLHSGIKKSTKMTICKTLHKCLQFAQFTNKF